MLYEFRTSIEQFTVSMSAAVLSLLWLGAATIWLGLSLWRSDTQSAFPSEQCWNGRPAASTTGPSTCSVVSWVRAPSLVQ
jgi:hypothetical protein